MKLMRWTIYLFLFVTNIWLSEVAIASDDGKSDEDVQRGTVIAEKDILFNTVQGLVGQTANIITGGEAPEKPDHIMAVLSMVFNYGIMTIAMFFMIFRAVKWVAATNTGQGQEKMFDFQSAPLPIFMSIVILLPLGSGYSPIQNLVILGAGQSISLANKETNAAADYLDKTGSFSISPAIMNSEKIGLDLLYNSICANSLNKLHGKEVVRPKFLSHSDLDDDIDYIVTSFDGIYSREEAVALSNVDMAEEYINGRTSSFPAGVCGQSRIQFGGIDAKYEVTGDVLEFRRRIKNAYKQLSNDVYGVSASFVESLFDPISITEEGPEYAQTIPSSIHADLAGSINTFRETYRHELELLVQKFQPENQTDSSGLSNRQATQKLREYGAGYLGVYFWEFAKRNSVTSSLTTIKHANRNPDLSLWQPHLSQDAQKKVMDSFESIASAIRLNYSENRLDRSEASRLDIMESLGPETDMAIAQAEHDWDVAAVTSVFTFFYEELYAEPDPVRGLLNLGHGIIETAELIIAAALATKTSLWAMQTTARTADVVADSAGPFGGPARGAAQVVINSTEFGMNVASKITEIVFMFLVFGIILAFWIPSIPMFHWISGLTGFMIVFAQAMILTPLLAVAHLISGDRSLLNSHTQHGYMAILQLMIYLPVMVIAFFVAYLILMASTKIIQTVFVPYFTTMLNDNIAGIVTFVLMNTLFIILNIQAFNRCFALITTFPEKAGQFIGGGVEMLGDNDNGSNKSSFVAVGAGIAQVGGKALSGGGDGNDSSQENRNARATVNERRLDQQVM